MLGLIFLVFQPNLCPTPSTRFFCLLLCVFRLFNHSWRSEDFPRFLFGSHHSLEISFRAWQANPRCLHVWGRSRTQAKRRNRNKHTMAKLLIVSTAKRCLVRRTVWRSTCDDRIQAGGRLRVTFVAKRSAILWVWNSTRKFTQMREHSSVNSATRRSNDHPHFPPTCLFIQIQGLSPATTAERGFIKNRTWRNTPTFTLARSHTSAYSAGKRLASRATSSLTAENIPVSNLFHVKYAIARSIEKLILGVTRTRMKWINWRSKILRSLRTVFDFVNCE